MAEIIVPPGYVNVQFKFALSNVKVMSFALAYKLTDPIISPDDQAEIASHAWTTDGTGWGANDMFPQWHHLGCHLIAGNDGPPLVGDFTTDVVGTASTNHSPPSNCAVVVKKTTGFAGRKFRGRAYIPPVSVNESNVDDAGVMTSLQRGDLQTAWDRFTDKLAGDLTSFDSFQLLHSEVDVLPTEITAMTVEGLLGTQRRRMR